MPLKVNSNSMPLPIAGVGGVMAMGLKTMVVKARGSSASTLRVMPVGVWTTPPSEYCSA